MFDLETAIAEWKKALADRESLSEDDIVELESHLRDCVTSLDAMGLSGEEAFLIAQRRVGQPAELDAEFSKVSPTIRWVHRGKWMCIGVLALIIIRSGGGLLLGVLRLIGSLSEVAPMTQSIVYNIAAIACSWLIVLVGLFVVLRHDALVDRIVQRLARIPKPILIGLPIAVISPLCVLILFNMYMTSGYGHIPLVLSFYAYRTSTPILLLVAAYVLHRSEQHRLLT